MFHPFQQLRGFLPFLKEVVSEDGYGSFSRFSGFLIVAFTLTWITYLVFRNHAMPDLEGPAIFITACAGTPYGINQAKRVVQAIKSGNPDPTPVTIGAITPAPVTIVEAAHAAQPE